MQGRITQEQYNKVLAGKLVLAKATQEKSAEEAFRQGRLTRELYESVLEDNLSVTDAKNAMRLLQQEQVTTEQYRTILKGKLTIADAKDGKDISKYRKWPKMRKVKKRKRG
jgi:hypothetical protein